MPPKFLIGRKRGMTQIFTPDGRCLPVTVVDAGPCPVVQVKTKETDGYSALQLGFHPQKESRLHKPVVGHFKKANVIHTGDVYVSGGYPIVDVSSGGRYEGFITAAEQILRLCDDKTRIIPGHGPVVGRREFLAWHDMLIKLRDRVAKRKAAKEGLEAIKAAKPAAEFDAKLGGGFVKADQLVEWIYSTAAP